jgi:GntR family transcriptional regulator / MocR family aminotransferase
MTRRRRHSIIAFDLIRLDRASSEPLHLQLYRQVRDQLRLGNFSENSSRLPSSRALAETLAVSRFTIKSALAKLHEEGYIRSEPGSGTFVAETLPENFLIADKSSPPRETAGAPRIARRVAEIGDNRKGTEFDVGSIGPPGVFFQPGQPAVDEFPIAIWERLRSRVLLNKGTHLLRYAPSHGDADLRKGIAAYLSDFRAARCHPDQIIVTAGTQQAMLISALALINRGDVAWMEDPGFHQARRSFVLAGATLVPRPIDSEGLVIERASNKKPPKVIYVTPSHQFPLGMTMSLERRRDLIGFVQKRDAYVFEDDYYSEFRFTGPPLPSLQGLDSFGRVIYAGTFSKILHPALRLGYLLVPEQLVDSMLKVRSAIDQHSSPIDQATLARFLNEGYFLSHIRRMRRLYAGRRQSFIKQFNYFLGDHFKLQIPEAGLHFIAWVRNSEDFARIKRVAANTRVNPEPLSFFCIKAKPSPAFVFGFAAWPEAQVKERLGQFAAALKESR